MDQSSDATRSVRSYRGSDLDALLAVSQAADGLFAQVGFLLPEDDPKVLLERCPVVLVSGDPLVGFGAAEEVDGGLHIAQLSVHPESGRRGVGTALLEALMTHARAKGHRAVTLTTFRDVPWNGPWYAARGFTPYPEEEWGPQLRRIWADEIEAGIMLAPRIAMRKTLPPASGSARAT